MRISKIIEAFDTHTSGNSTRNLIGGVPNLEGNTMVEKMKYFEDNYDWIRKTTMWEPRGHANMSGTVITTPCNPEADMGVFYIDTSGYMPMCGHSTIGVATAMIESGMVAAKEPYTIIKIDTPAGLVTAKAHVENNAVKSVTFTNIPSFHYASDILEIDGYGEVPVDVAYGGNSYAIVSADKFNLRLEPDNLDEIYRITRLVHKAANEKVGFIHPEKTFINKITHVQFYTAPTNPEATYKNTVVFLPLSIDRSPCGTGTSARVANLVSKGELKMNEELVHESIIGGIFRARAVESTKVGEFNAIIPEVTGSAYTTGLLKFVIDPDDPLRHGFLMG